MQGLAPRPSRRHQSQRRQEHPAPRKVRRQRKYPALPRRRYHARSPLLVPEDCPGRICSSEFSESTPYDVNAATRCGCWLRSPSRPWQSVFSSAWASRPGRHLSRRRAHRPPLRSPGSKSPQTTTSRRPMTGLLVPEHRDERAPDPRDPASAQPGPEGRAAPAIRLMGPHGEPHALGQAAGALKSPPDRRELRLLAPRLLGWV